MKNTLNKIPGRSISLPMRNELDDKLYRRLFPEIKAKGFPKFSRIIYNQFGSKLALRDVG